MNIRRNVLIIVYVLSISMILSGCDSGEGHTANEQEDLYVLDVNEVVVNEEEKTVEPKDVTWIDKNLVKVDNYEYTFQVSPGNGKNLNIAVKSNSSIRIKFVVYMSGKEVENTVLKGNEGKTLSYQIDKTKTFRVTLDPYGGDSDVFSASIRARQF